jgi:hypothetical protein
MHCHCSYQAATYLESVEVAGPQGQLATFQCSPLTLLMPVLCCVPDANPYAVAWRVGNHHSAAQGLCQPDELQANGSKAGEGPGQQQGKRGFTFVLRGKQGKAGMWNS